MKRFIGFILDILFFVSFLGVLTAVGLFVLYTQRNDISILNDYLQTQLTWSLFAIYGVLLGAFLVYYWFLPIGLKQTVGQRLAGNVFFSEGKVNMWTIFLKNVVGLFWDILLFPYTIIAALLRKRIISTRLSGITTIPAEGKRLPLGATLATLVFTLFLVSTIGMGTYIYKQGVTTMLERYTDYERQMKLLIEQFAYQDAQPILEKYKQYHGEDANYAFYRCQIESNLSTEIEHLDLCKIALEKNSENNDRVKQILAEEAKIYAANDEYKEAETIYARLWNEFQDRSLNMKNYVVILSELGKSKDATTILNELATQVPSTDPIGLRDLGNLYERIGQVDLALEKYTAALAVIPETENQSLAGELHYYIGVIQYRKNKLTEAKVSFEQAKALNKDYADPADSYIILISKLKNSVTK